MTDWTTKTRTLRALGLCNVARAAAYRLGVKFGINPVRRLKASVPNGPFFLPVQTNRVIDAPAVSAWQTIGLLFSHWQIGLTDAAPEWMANPLNGQRVPGPEREWWLFSDFDPAVGDIKLIWELSRMDWVLAFAQRASQNDVTALKRLNEWLTDWTYQNPPYKGPNWKCGQEASIRVMHLAMAAMMLGQIHSVAPGLRDLVRLHLQRIAPTLQYAIAQDNNHGTSEAAALFIGGSWLVAVGLSEAQSWANMGRRWLENRADHLVDTKGSFSQYSLNYHRVMLDTFCMVEVWCRQLGLLPFSTSWKARALAATEWLRHMVNSVNGDGPNIGANDGARLLQLTETSYRDHRPTVQLAMVLFAGKRAYAQSGLYDYPMQWLGVELPSEIAPAPKSYIADDGGFAILRRGAVMALLRYPRFRFRPSQADALHMDLWLGAENVLRDAGTYSYNTEPEWFNYFGGTASHNTVQFDGRDQMPRISRFLFGNWLKTERLQALTNDGKATNFGAGYCDSSGACHHRQVSVYDTGLKVIDEVKGFANRAVLRWRLMPGDWSPLPTSSGFRLSHGVSDEFSLSVTSSVPVKRFELVPGWESRHYMDKTELPVLEVEIEQAGTLTTEFHWT